MSTYKVVLTKLYAVTVKARGEKQARHIAEFYTGDIKDISIIQDRKKYKFSIENIECRMNEGLEAEKIYE
jgi:hypothetical protein